MATANPYKPNGNVDIDTVLNVTTYSNDPLLSGDGGGYYIKRHMRVPMKVDSETEMKHVAIFPKTIASQVIQTTEMAFVTETSRTTLESLAIVDNPDPSGGDTSKHLSINGVMQPSYYEIGEIQYNVSTVATLVGDENYGLIKKVNTLEAFFDGAAFADDTIDKWHEIEAFLENITDEDTLEGLILNAVNGITGTAENNTGTTTFHKDTTFKNDLKNRYSIYSRRKCYFNFFMQDLVKADNRTTQLI